ncbi:tyrosine-type recombinase/integrase [Geodermatophilus sp. SYSU D00779]
MTSRRGDPAGGPAGAVPAAPAGRGEGARTIELYSQSVRYFSRWLTDRGREPVLDELTRHAIAAWLAELAETAEPSTVGTRLRGMRGFCRWLVTEGELEKAPTDGIEIPSPPDKPVPVLTDEEIAALQKACAVGRGRPGIFDRTIFLGRRDEVVHASSGPAPRRPAGRSSAGRRRARRPRCARTFVSTRAPAGTTT